MTRAIFVRILSRILYGYKYEYDQEQALKEIQDSGYIYPTSHANIEHHGTILLIFQKIAQ